MEQLMAHAMNSHNQPQHQFHPGQIDLKSFGPPFIQGYYNLDLCKVNESLVATCHPQTTVGMHQQQFMGNPNMALNHHPSVSLQIPDPHKMVKQEQQSFNKMPQQPPNLNLNPPFLPPECQYPLMSPAPLAQNLTVKKEKTSISNDPTTAFDGERNDAWLTNGNTTNTTTTTTKTKKTKGSRRSSEPGGQKSSKSQKRRFSTNSVIPPPPTAVIVQKEKPFECVTCGRRFTQRIGMLQHQRRHTGERPFGCNYCDKRFTQKSGLVQHERLHTNEKPFNCSYCEKSFTQKSGLVQHERTHTGEKPYVCAVCGKAFTQLSGLKQHKKVHERASETASSK